RVEHCSESPAVVNGIQPLKIHLGKRCRGRRAKLQRRLTTWNGAPIDGPPPHPQRSVGRVGAAIHPVVYSLGLEYLPIRFLPISTAGCRTASPLDSACSLLANRPVT